VIRTALRPGTLFAVDPAMRAATLLICLLFVTGCDENSPTGPTVSLNQRFTLAPGELADVDNTDVRFQFVRVTGDSRCPADAICIQGGDALVEIRASGADASTLLGLHTGDSSQASAPYGGVRITLVELQPYPFSSRTIAQDEYRATLMVTR
jgi:hypothetical protein